MALTKFSKNYRSLRKTMLVALLLSATYAAALIIAGTIDDARPSDTAVILGSKVELTGQPSARLAARLDQGAVMYRAGLARTLIVSGGVGREGFDEAAVMRDYLVGKGVPAGAIIVDSLGLDTQATAANCAAIMRARGWSSAIVVTQHFHVPRTRLALRMAGVKHVTVTHAHFAEWRDIYSTLRELVALPIYWLAHS